MSSLQSSSLVLVPFHPKYKSAPFFENVHILPTSGKSTSEHLRYKSCILLYGHTIRRQTCYNVTLGRTPPGEKNDDFGISEKCDRFDLETPQKGQSSYMCTVWAIVGTMQIHSVPPRRKRRKKLSTPQSSLPLQNSIFDH